MNRPESTPTSERLVKSMFGMLFFRVGGQVITFILIAMLARYLGPGNFGIYSTLTIFIGFCAIFLAPGLNDLMIREAMDKSKNPSDSLLLRNNAIRAGYGLRLALAFLGISVALIIGPSMRWDGVTLGLIALAAVSLLTSLAMPSFRFVYDVPLQLDYRMDRAAGINFLGRTILLAAIGIAIFYDLNLFGIVSLQAAGETAAFIVLVFILFRNSYPVKPAFNFKAIKVVVILALPIIISEALTITYTRLDVLFLNHFTGAREAGIFAGPVRIIDGLQIIPTVILGALVPLFNRLKNNNPAGLDRVFWLSARALWACGIVCAVAIYPFSSSITNLFFGSQFTDSAAILKTGVFCAPLIFAGTLIPALLIVQTSQKYIAWIYLFLAVVNIGLNLFLIPNMGASGAIISKLWTYAAIFPVALLFSASRKAGWTLISQGISPLLLSFVAVYYIDSLSLPFWWGLPALTSVAVAVFWFSGWFGRRYLTELLHFLTGRLSTEKR